MRRFFVKPEELNAQVPVQLTGDEFHHLKNVCRLEEGERVELLDGKGRIAVAVIESLGKKSAELKVESIRDLPPPARPQVEIVLCVPRFQKMDVIIQKSVELGAARLIPVVSDRSFIKTINKEAEGKIPRWQKIAAEACKQSGRAWPLELAPFETLKGRLQKTPRELGLFLYEGESSRDIKTALEGWKNLPDRLTVFIGAEGGFSTEEVKMFEAHGLRSVTLGSLVLRVETACIAILSIIQYHFGVMR